MSKNNLIHIKLDKLIYGKNQHIFKTTIEKTQSDNIIKNPNNNKKFIQNTIMYSNYNQILNESKNYELLDFDEINFLYKINNKFSVIQQYLNNISDYYKQIFFKNLTPEQNKQNIYYFKNIEKPIDIINIDNTGFFLSKINNYKNTLIEEQQQLLNNSDYNIKATNKYNYSKAWNYNTNRENNFPENNGIFIYDLAFNFIDTVNLSTYQNLQNFITKYDFSNISSNFIYINENDNYYGINTKNLLNELNNNIEFNYKFSTNDIINILTEILSNISNNSINRYIDKYGIISKLDKNYFKTLVDNKVISSLFKNMTNEQIYSIFYGHHVDSYTTNEIPQNMLYTTNLNTEVNIPNEIYNKISTYLNFVSLKNSQNPEYEYNIEFPSTLYDIINLDNSIMYITISYDKLSTIFELDPGKYNIKYISGEFGIYGKYNYENSLMHTMNFNGMQNIPANISALISGKTINTTSSIISSHILEGAYQAQFLNASNYDEKISFDKNKARFIDFNLPPIYKYNLSAYTPGLTGQSFYTKSNFIDEYTYIKFPKNVVALYQLSSDINLLSTDFNPYISETEQNVFTNISTNIESKNKYILTFKLSDNYNIFGTCTFKITNTIVNTNNISKYIDNLDILQLYDIDKNKSLLYNQSDKYKYSKIDETFYLNPTKENIKNILSTAAIKDLNTAETNQEYSNNYTDRLSSKIDNYINQFNEYHVETNRICETGQLNGLRIYEHIGKSNDNNIWSSYKYITTKNNNILNALTLSISLPFKPYNINRLSQNMQLNILGNIIYKGTNDIKAMNDNTSKQYVFYDTTVKDYFCKTCFNCKLSGTVCNKGYCTFPYNNQAKIKTQNGNVYPNAVYYNYTDSNLNNIYKIENQRNFDQEIIAKTDISVNDDIEIYFIKNTVSNESINQLFQNEKFKQYTFKSIFQGFGRQQYTK